MAKYLFGKNVSGNTISVYDLIDQPQECHGETYLHKLGKMMFLELYKDSLANNIPLLNATNIVRII